MKLFPKILSAVLASVACSFAALAAVEVEDEAYYAKFRDQGISLNVYNWGEYISDGTEDSMDVVKEFEAVSGINVNYTMYDTNEDMYAKITGGGSQYDIIIPSDYMIARLIAEDRLEKLDYANIPNVANLEERFLKPEFDPEGAYSVPYTWNLVGLVYNTKYITPEKAQSWNILWDEDYKGKVLMFGNSRDAYGIALSLLGYSLNTEDLDELQEATDLLTAQKKVNQMYAMDQTFDKMANENAYAAPYYAGDCVTMMERNEDLAFSYPKEGVNEFIDAICIPKGTKNKEAAEAFINFLCEKEVAAANCEFISYFSPLKEEIIEEMGLEYDERIDPTINPPEKTETFTMLGDEANSFMENNWLKIKRTSGFDSPIYTLAIVLILALVIFLILYIFRKRKKRQYDV